MKNVYESVKVKIASPFVDASTSFETKLYYAVTADMNVELWYEAPIVTAGEYQRYATKKAHFKF